MSHRALVTAIAMASAFLVCSLGFWLAGGAPLPGWHGVWLTLLCVLLGRVEFKVSKGISTPVMLAIVQLLMLAPAPIVPLLVGLAHVLIRLPEARRRHRSLVLLLPL